jgi:class 3 adenylate cyclase
MFSDMEGFTEMTERLGDQQALEVARAHNAIVREALAAHGGRELELQGDGFLLAFAAAADALGCALAIQRALTAHSSTNPENPIRVRIGIHTGEPIREADRLFGKSVILAARIAAQAKGGEILVSSVVKDLCEGTGLMRFDAGRELELKGISGKRRVFRALWTEEELSQPAAASSAAKATTGRSSTRGKRSV